MYTQVIFWTIGILAGLAMICCLIGFCRASTLKKVKCSSLICVESPEKAMDNVVEIANPKPYLLSKDERMGPPGKPA